MQEKADLFKVFSDATRLRLAILLAVKGELCVCFLAEALNEPEFKISRHLNILKLNKIVETRKEGTWVYYKLSEPKNDLEKTLFDYFKNGLINDEITKEDLNRINKKICSSK